MTYAIIFGLFLSFRQLLESHQRELDDLVEKLDAERNKQQRNLKQKLEERKRQKEEALKRKQEAELAKELLEQKKELAETHLAAVCYLKIFKVYFPS